ncbi:SPAG5 protein, partial [Poecile atricapillus]|nr:SPAG5 protein [Poecile atricapillus]
QNEKSLQDLVKQQEKKMLQLVDMRGEVVRLKAEVSELKHLLHHAETEAKMLREEMRDKEQQVGTACIPQRGLFLLQVDNLRLLLVEKENENMQLTDKY